MTRRDAITAALIDAFNGITIANGYNTDLGARGRVQKPVGDANAANVLPFGILTVPRESKDDNVVANYIHCTMDVELAVAPVSAEDGYVEEDVEALLEDCERVIYALKAQEPPLNISGVVDLEYRGHEKLPLRGDLVFCGAVLNLVVMYRHDFDDPRTYMASASVAPPAIYVPPPDILGVPVIAAP